MMSSGSGSNLICRRMRARDITLHWRRVAQSRRSRKILLLSLVLLRDGYITRYLCERPALDAAIDAALSAGVAVHTVVETLERKENAALSHGRIASVLMCLGGAFRSCLASG